MDFGVGEIERHLVIQVWNSVKSPRLEIHIQQLSAYICPLAKKWVDSLRNEQIYVMVRRKPSKVWEDTVLRRRCLMVGVGGRRVQEVPEKYERRIFLIFKFKCIKINFCLVYSSASFYTWVESCNHHLRYNVELPQPPKPGNHQSVFYVFLPFPKFHTNGIIQHIAFKKIFLFF